MHDTTLDGHMGRNRCSSESRRYFHIIRSDVGPRVRHATRVPARLGKRLLLHQLTAAAHVATATLLLVSISFDVNISWSYLTLLTRRLHVYLEQLTA